MWMFIGLVSFVVFFVFGIMWIVALIKKNGKATRNFIVSAICFWLIVIAVIASPTTDDTGVTNALNSDTSTEVIKANVELADPVETTEEKEKQEEDTKQKLEDDAEAAEALKTPEPTTTPAVVQKSVSETSGQRNAVRAAKSYLDFAAFSRQGLINQLTFEGYADADAKYAVDKIDADWNEQAEKTAKNYLDFSAFSKQELIKQLEFEGYTSEQAIYGVDKSYE